MIFFIFKSSKNNLLNQIRTQWIQINANQLKEWERLGWISKLPFDFMSTN